MKIVAILLTLFVFCFNAHALNDQSTSEEIIVFAAASLADAMKKIAAEFQSEYGTKVYLNFAGSQTLRTQIESGAECDIFLSADQFNAQRLIEEGFVRNTMKEDIFSNSLVVISSQKKAERFNDLRMLTDDSIQYISLADTNNVPAGIYAKEALSNSGYWEDIRRKVVPALDVRAALKLVELGEAQYGIVYMTDIALKDKISVLYEIPPEFHSPIAYSLCLLKDKENNLISKLLYSYLQSDKIKNIFYEFGFIPL